MTDMDEENTHDAAATLSGDSTIQHQTSRTRVISTTAALNQDEDGEFGDVADGSCNNDEEATYIGKCPICLCAYEENDEIAWSHNNTCRHLFHRQCIEKWLLKNERCPCCRSLFLFFVNSDEEVTIHNADGVINSNSDSEGRPSGWQSSSSSALPINTVDSSMHRDADELLDGDNEETDRSLARGMDVFHRFATGSGRHSSTTDVLPAHADSTISTPRVSSNRHHHVEMTVFPTSTNDSATAPQAIASAVVEENLESYSPPPVLHDDPAITSSMIVITATVDDTAVERGTAQAPALGIERVSVNSRCSGDVVSPAEEEVAL
jgi:Ring finger domain